MKKQQSRQQVWITYSTDTGTPVLPKSQLNYVSAKTDVPRLL